MQRPHFGRVHLLILGSLALAGIVILRLFELQVLQHKRYVEIAQAEQMGTTTLPARRGEILIQDHNSQESYKLATNTTLNMIFADPTGIKNPSLVAETLAPLLFDLNLEKEKDKKRYEDEWDIIQQIQDETLRQELVDKLTYKSDEELLEDYEKELEDIFSTKTRTQILINTEPLDPDTQKKISALNLPGFELTETGNLLAYPNQIPDKAKAARSLAEIFDTDATALKTTLEGKNRYVILKHKLDPAVSNQIEEILKKDRQPLDPDDPESEPPYDFLGIRLVEEYFRYYPEGELAAQVLGFVNSTGNGEYGIEGTFNDILKGKDGVFTSQLDGHMNQITVGQTIIEQAEDGANITLTIDRAIQLQVERALSRGVKEYGADSGQAIVMNPKTGEILAMANYPTFDPNQYGDIYELKDVEFTEDEKKRIFVDEVPEGSKEEPKHWFYKQIDPDVRIQIFPKEENPEEYRAYKNEVGPEVYKNKTTQESYEPGSIFKPLTMVSAIEAGEVTANTTFVDSGPIPVDYNVYTGEYDSYIETSDKKYNGLMTMTQVLQKSSNTGMTFVVRKLGAPLFYSYLKAFGFLERTDLGFEDEVLGKIEHYEKWTAESEMITKAFGQGLTVTPIQLVQAYSALANNGLMMKPMIVKQIDYPDGSREEFEPKSVRQVITEDSAQMITSMMTATGESYVNIRLPDHFVAIKSGTAQTYKWGRALSGVGTTIGSFVGFGPIDDPEFLVLVKMDRARNVEWAEGNAGRVFKQIMEFLFDYYSIPPDKSEV